MKISAIYLLVVGLLWALGVGFAWIVMNSIAEPISVFSPYLYFAAMLIGPALLTVEAIFIVKRSRQKLAVVLVSIECIILTIMMGYDTVLAFHVRPLQAKPPYSLYVALVIMIALADVSAWRVYRHIFVHRHSPI